MTGAAAYFGNLYGQNSDPWNYAQSDYERQKYDATCAALMSSRYGSGLELGCSVGVLSARVAVRCDEFLAVDLVPKAVDQAAARLADIAGASAIVMNIPTDWPAKRFDLILLSEVIYYLTEPGLRLLARRIAENCLPGAECVLVNWLGDTDAYFSGVEARRTFCNALRQLRGFGEVVHAGSPDYEHVTLVMD